MLTVMSCTNATGEDTASGGVGDTRGGLAVQIHELSLDIIINYGW